MCRSVDAAAGQLIAREAGGFVSFLGHGGIEAPLDLDARYRLVAARTPGGPGHARPGAHAAGVPALTAEWLQPAQLVASSDQSAIWAALRTP